MRALCLLLLTCAWAQAQPAVEQHWEDGPLRLSVSVDRNQITAAEVVELTLEVEYPEDAEVAIPASRDQLGSFLIEAYKVDPPRLVSSGSLAITQRMTLAPLEPGELTIPSLRSDATLADQRMLSLSTDEIPITVTSLLTDEAEGEPTLRDIAEPLAPPIPLAWKLGALAFALAAVGAFIWWRRSRKNRPEAVEPAVIIPPGEAALKRLDELSASDLLDAGDFRQFHFELSDILREYIERRFSIRAQEQTTDEFLAGLPNQRVFGSQQQVLLQDFLRRSDLVKFAKYTPPIEQSRDAVQACRAFILETDAAGLPEGTLE